MKKTKRPELITTFEAAKIAKVSIRTVYRWLENGAWVEGLGKNYLAGSQFNAVMFSRLWIEKNSFLTALKEAGRI